MAKNIYLLQYMAAFLLVVEGLMMDYRRYEIKVERKSRIGINSPYWSYQRFCRINEAKGSFCIELAHKPLLHVQ